MRRLMIVLVMLLPGGAEVAPLAAEFPAGELFLLGSHVTGDFGTGVASDVEAVTVRYLTGGKLQLRVDLPLLRVESTSAVTHTGIGWVPARRGSNPSSTQDPPSPGSRSVATRTAGVGDVRLGFARRVAGGGIRLHRADAVLEVKIPTAEEEKGLGTGEWDYRLGLSGEYRFWSMTAFGGVGWNRLGDPAWVELNDVLDGYAGVESQPLTGRRLIVCGWLEGSDEVVEGASGRAVVGVGLRTTGRIRWRFSATGGIGGASEDVAILLGLAFGVASNGPALRGVQR